jgi:nucleoside-diphosphate-sugar epimerase
VRILITGSSGFLERQAVRVALESFASKGAVMNPGSDEVPALREVVPALYHHSGARPRLIDVGASVARIAVKGLSAPRLWPLEPQHLEIALRDHLFDNRLAKKLLDWRPLKNDIESAVDACDWLVSGGLD